MADLVLHLRPEEQSAFNALSDALRDGWDIREETIDADERPEELKMRSLMFDIDDENAKAVVERVPRVSSPDEVRQIFEDLSSLPQPVLLEVLFTLGTRSLSTFIQSALSQAATDDDLRAVAELSGIRHALLESNAGVPSPSSS